MNILEKIIAEKKIEVATQKEACAVSKLERMSLFNRDCISIKNRIREEGNKGIIAEFKRQSPSKGVINASATPIDVAIGYQKASVAAMSVLTDTKFFGGALQDLEQVRQNVSIPLLRKDFLIDEYQVIEAKAYGADIILLIAANLTIDLTRELAKLAKSIGLEVLLELHGAEELDFINEHIDLVGINNRNLKTFEVSLETSLNMADKIDNSFIRVAESGISKIENIQLLRTVGYEAFLIGENFMKQQNPGLACQEFMNQLNLSVYES